jgi:hypothetical protein
LAPSRRSVSTVCRAFVSVAAITRSPFAVVGGDEHRPQGGVLDWGGVLAGEVGEPPAFRSGVVTLRRRRRRRPPTRFRLYRLVASASRR